MYQRSIKVTIFSTVKLPKYWSLFSLCKHNCLNKLIIYINRDKFFYKSKNITNEQVDLIKWNLFWFCVAKINKRPIRHARKSEYRGKLKTGPKRTKRSVPKNAKRSVPETFRSVPKTFRFVPKAFRSVLEAFRFVQTVQRSCGVVVRFRVCWRCKDNVIIVIFKVKYPTFEWLNGKIKNVEKTRWKYKPFI